MPETGEQLKVPDRKLYAPQEGLRLIDDHIRQTIQHSSYIAPWRPVLVIKDREGIRIPSYYQSIFVPDAKSLEEGLPVLFSKHGFDLTEKPVVERKAFWSRHKTEFIPGFIWKNGILVPNMDSAPVSKLNSPTDNQATALQADMRVYGGKEEGLYLTKTVYEDGETVFDRSGRIVKEVGRQEIYGIHRAKSPNSIISQSPLGLGWVREPPRSL